MSQITDKQGAGRSRKIIRDPIRSITKPAIQRLMLKAGVEQFGGLLYEESRSVLESRLEELLRDSIRVMLHAKARTLSKKHVETALGILGQAVAIPSGSYKTASLGVKKRAAKMRNLQKDAESLILPRAAFMRLVKKIGLGYNLDVRYSKDALDLIQVYSEAKMIQIYAAANMIAKSASRKTLMPKDIYVARRILGQRN